MMGEIIFQETSRHIKMRYFAYQSHITKVGKHMTMESK